MTKRIMMMAVCLTALLTLSWAYPNGVTQKPGNDPKAVVDKFLSSLKSGDYIDAATCLDWSKLKFKIRDGEEFLKRRNEVMKEEINNNGGIKSFKFLSDDWKDVSFTEREHYLKYRVEYKDGYSTTMSYKLRKVAGKWLIVN